MHSSAMWGQLDTLKTLVELNADLQATNFLGEKAVDVARRYCKPDCEEYLAWAGENKKQLGYLQLSNLDVNAHMILSLQMLNKICKH